METLAVWILMSIFNFDEYLGIFRILFYWVLPPVLVILAIYTIWGIFQDMKEDLMEEEELQEAME